MEPLNSNFEFNYFPGDHFTIFTPEYLEKGNAFLAGRYAVWVGENGK